MMAAPTDSNRCRPPDPGRVFREAFRVLKPGGRFAVSDVVVRGEVPDPIRKSMELWVGCIAGALHEDAYKTLLVEAGFDQVDLSNRGREAVRGGCWLGRRQGRAGG